MDQRTGKSTEISGPISDGKQECTERAAAFFNSLELATLINENDPFVLLAAQIG